MDILISKTPTELKTCVELILEHRLHFSRNGLTKKEAEFILEYSNFDKETKQYRWIYNKTKYKRDFFIAGIASINNTPIGAVLLVGFQIHFYVKSSYRRMGVATQLFNEIIKHHDLSNRICLMAHTKRSVRLANKLNIPTSIKDMFIKKLNT